MTEVAPRCPDAEVLAAFIAGTLGPRELEVVSSHLAECPECRSIIGEAVRFDREESGTVAAEGPADRSTMPWWLVAAAVLAVAVVAAAPWVMSRFRPAPLIAQLAAAAPATDRTIEPRISGFGWAPLRTVTRGANERATPAQMKLVGAAGNVLEQTGTQDTPEAKHAAGVANLVTERRAEAITALTAAAESSKDARVWSDLAAAQYAAAVRDDAPEHLKDALAAADHALKLDPKLPEALFNRALTLDRMGLRDLGRSAWQSYLAADPTGGWANEARHRLAADSTPQTHFRDVLQRAYPQLAAGNGAAAADIVRRYPQESRAWGEAEILPRWAAAAKVNDEAHAAEHLGVARALGAALKRRSGEGLLSAAVAAVDSAGPSERLALIEAFATYHSARMTYALHKAAEAEKPLLHAAKLFEVGRSPMAAVARYYAANTAFDQNRIADSRALLQSIVVPPDALALRAQIDWELALCSYATGEVGRSLALATSSAAAFDRLGESDSAAFLNAIAADSYSLLGDEANAWRRQIAALQRLGRGDNPRLPSAVTAAALMAERQRDIPAAQSLLTIAIESNERSRQTLSLVQSLLHRARVSRRLGDTRAAREDIERARRVTAETKEPGDRRREDIDCRAALAALDAETSPATAIADLSEAIEFHRAEGRRNLVPELLVTRARANRSAGRNAEAARDVDEAMQALESMRAAAPAGPVRWGMFDLLGEIFEEAVRLEVDRGDAPAALAYADRNRARLLLDRYHAEPIAAAPALPGGTALVEYSSLEDRLIAFVVREGKIEVVQQPIGREGVARRVESCLREVAGAAGREPSACASAYDLLMRPLEKSISTASSVVVVPDVTLQRVPFAALYDGERDRYAVEQWTLVDAPSAATYEQSAHRQELLAGRTAKTIVIVGDPKRADAERLEGSRREISEIAAAYAGATTLEGAQASVSAFVDRARRADLVHFAGHGALDDVRGVSSLLFAPAGNDDGTLDAARIAALDLPQTRAVILAACSTARGRSGGNEGTDSVARAFLATGVPSVVATLWPVEDGASAEFFSRLHRHLAAGEPPAEAVRHTQIEFIHRGTTRSTNVWAAVEVIGS